MNQLILSSKNNYLDLKEYLSKNSINNIFVVCFEFSVKPNIIKELESLNIKITYFFDFKPNPTYESVCAGIKEFHKSGSNFILAIGGGSAIDVAKSIKLYANMNEKLNYLKQEIVLNDIVLMAVPTTAGTGSEATRYAVIYYENEKQSITHESIIPSVVLMDSSLLETLPNYQKKATLMDAFSHSIESYWSVNSTEESKEYSKKAISIILKNMKDYLNDKKEVYEEMLMASNYAGKAINITQTTAGHAMCYKLTSLYNIAHGHAAILINSVLLPFMLDNIYKCSDFRGKDYLVETFKELGKILNCQNNTELKNYLKKLLKDLDLYNINMNLNDIDLLTNSVNETRLKNNPISLTKEDIKIIYLDLYNEVKARIEKNGSKKIC